MMVYDTPAFSIVSLKTGVWNPRFLLAIGVVALILAWLLGLDVTSVID